MSQLQFALGTPAHETAFRSPERRIDITFGLLREIYDALSEDERSRLNELPAFITIETLFKLRAMERGEEEALGTPHRPGSIADLYDDLVTPGEPAGEAMLRVFRAMFNRGE